MDKERQYHMKVFGTITKNKDTKDLDKCDWEERDREISRSVYMMHLNHKSYGFVPFSCRH